MSRCLQLAKLGSGSVAPNPLVGAVIVLNDQIIGGGYHKKYGKAHAEVNAVDSVKDKSILAQSTIYVSLEPCAHHGKTPPCADLLVKHNFKRVVIGCTDSFSEVSGKGVQRLKEAGIEIELGVLESECRAMNRHFFTFHEQKRPYVLLKWAQTQNKLIDSENGQTGEVTWISCPETQSKVHQWRNEYQAILVGKNTVLKDDPSLTVRAIRGSNPIRIILDSLLELDDQVQVKDKCAQTIILNKVKTESDRSCDYIKIEDMIAKSILSKLYELNIQSVLIEGGRATLQSFIDSSLWDEARIITGSTSFNVGTSAPKITGVSYHHEIFFSDKINYLFNQ